MDYQIEKNIPLPKPRATNIKYPFGQMQKGDSFAVKLEEYRRADRAARAYGWKHNMKFSVRKDEDGVPRIWRVK